MRDFWSSRKRLSDPRITLVFILMLILLLGMACILAVRADARLRQYELDACRGVMTECADALRTWTDSEDEQLRLSAALRFGSAAARLPDAPAREALFPFADRLRAGDDTAAADAAALADALSLLAAVDYPDADMLHAALARALSEMLPDAPEVPPEAAAADAQLTEYSRTIAERAAKQLFGDQVTCRLSENGGAWVAETENMRMIFSGFDGKLESLVYIRLGAAPDVRCTESEIVERAQAFADRLGLRIIEGTAADRLGDFTSVLLTGRTEDYRAVLDGAGRVWCMFKVKR